MKIRSIVAISGDYGTIDVEGENYKGQITLTKEDAQQVLYLAERIYEGHQARIAEEFARPLPALAFFTEVPANEESF